MSERRWQPTVAVSALLWHGDSVLFLHRVQAPILWAPPGGRVRADEGPLEALHREIAEETGPRQARIVVPFIAEAGQHAGEDILFLDFVGRWAGGHLRLDPAEHDEWRWLDLRRLSQAQVEKRQAAGGEPFYVYRWDNGEELDCSHSCEQLQLSRRILACLDAGADR